VTATRHQACAVLRLFEQQDELLTKLREVEIALAANGRALGRAHGIIVPLKGRALRDLAEATLSPAALEPTPCSPLIPSASRGGRGPAVTPHGGGADHFACPEHGRRAGAGRKVA
jgi:hypothetical protein